MSQRPTARAAALALVTIWATACAAVGRPGPAPPTPASPALGCQALRGTPQGLLLQMDVPADLPSDTLLALYRGDAEVVAFPLSDLEALPAEVMLGDAGVEAGAAYRYTCVAFGEGDALLAQAGLSLTIPPAPPRPSAPRLEATDAGVRVTWSVDPAVPVRVYRRDVLADGPSAPLSPALLAPDWLDGGVEPGGVYAYALQASLLWDDVAWESELGPERYIETAVAP